LREPIFLTASFLDVAPADPHGRGGVSESDDSTHESRVEEINSALLSLFAARADESASATTQEDEMDLEQIIEALKSAMGEAAGEYVSEIKEALVDAAKVPVLEARVVELEAELETVKAEKDAVSVALEAKVTALEAATAELAEATAQLETVTAERDEFLAAKAVEEATRIREARLAQLPQAYRTALEARDEETRERIIGRLVKLTDEDFAEEVNTLNESLPGKTSMADLSREQGILPSFVGNPIGGAYAIDKYVD
jgi:DNA repair exonuclease SbcCD ATPase subunit